MAFHDDSLKQIHHIALLSGGSNGERKVSLQSGAAVYEALKAAGYEIAKIDPVEVDLKTVNWNQFEIVFLALHGPFGEDGQVQQILEQVGIPYTGSDSVVSQVAFRKSSAKERFRQCGIPTPESVLVNEADDRKAITRTAESLGFPLVVKPDSQGSSLGISFVRNPADLSHALELCFKFDSCALLEKEIVGTEWTLGVLDEMALPLIRIETPKGFYDYAAKYEDDATRYLFDFNLPTSVVNSIEQVGHEAARALGTKGIARVDLRLDEQHRPWVLEVNTIPGMTSHSLVPKAAQQAGIDFSELCERALVSGYATSPVSR